MELNEETQDGAILGAFVKQFYAGTPYLPSEIFLEYPIEDMDTIEKWLGKKRGGRVRLYVPVRGTKHRMIEMAKENAKNVLRMDRDKLKREEKRTIGAVHEIERLLGIRGLD